MTLLGLSETRADETDELLAECESTLWICDKLVTEYRSVAQDSIDSLKQAEAQLVSAQAELMRDEQKIIELKNPPWYKDFKYTFILGVLFGGVALETSR